MTFFGLGNPGERYADSRHNVGFVVVAELARRLHARFRHLPGKYVARKEHAGEPLVLVKPLLYMNESGVVVQEHLAEEPDRFVVVCDDLALPFGRLRLRPRGSAGGHKGLGSIIYRLGTDNFLRLRIGIGSPGPGQDGVDYVLEPFPKEEAAELPSVVSRAADCCMELVARGLEAAMNRFNSEPEETVDSGLSTVDRTKSEVQSPESSVQS